MRPTRKRARIGVASSLAAQAASLFGLAPRGVYLAVECCHRRGALLPHRFTLTGQNLFPGNDLGGLFSVALSVGSRPPGVTWHVIRGSPDFPPRPNQWNAAIARPTSGVTIRTCRPRLKRPSRCILAAQLHRQRVRIRTAPSGKLCCDSGRLAGGNSGTSSSSARRMRFMSALFCGGGAPCTIRVISPRCRFGSCCASWRSCSSVPRYTVS